ncbi:DUF2141 domain-containing protein [Sphingobium sp. BYY-5]|uniref:DUF2141 domain-containing protein n=1 Tax=Sphingobium sp. BYY-5 TaxID=2926400 RepID=UPI001FA81884|nr:DUF2141 domain-containing protein [Sphingobium sp. BYY-5]MCI4588847.1 DUF2141 domain-containing protein [Sphingobium sp. BYY-5]
MIALMLWAATSSLPSSPDLGKAEGQCRPDEHGPSFLVTANGLKDRQGRLKLELYPANDTDFLADDNVLVAAGKTFRRVEIAVPASGPVQLCIRAPGPGVYALSLLHDRDGNRKFSVSIDGIGFAGNPKLGLSKPSASAASARALTGPTPISITLNYRRGLFSFGPLER